MTSLALTKANWNSVHRFKKSIVHCNAFWPWIQIQAQLVLKIKNVNFDIIHLFDDNLIEHFNRLYPNTTIVNNQYLDGLFVSDVVNNPVVKKTVQITCDLNQLNDSTHINNVLKIYEEVL